MTTATEYRELAREYAKQAAASYDKKTRESLLESSRMCMLAALRMDSPVQRRSV